MINVLVIGEGYLGKYLHNKFGWDILKSEFVWQQGLGHYDAFVYTTWVTNVDEWEKDYTKCLSISIEPLAYLLETYDKPIIFISSAFVFDGRKGSLNCLNPLNNYQEFEDTNPINNYGRGKIYAEKLLGDSDIIVRVDDTYGPGKMYRYPMAPTDRYSTPTYVDDLAVVIEAIINNPLSIKEKGNIFHVGGNVSISRYDFIRRYHSCKPCLISELGLLAKRPRVSSLSNRLTYETFNIRPTPMEKAIQKSLEEK